MMSNSLTSLNEHLTARSSGRNNLPLGYSHSHYQDACSPMFLRELLGVLDKKVTERKCRKTHGILKNDLLAHEENRIEEMETFLTFPSPNYYV